jgi:hypothetical protein
MDEDPSHVWWNGTAISRRFLGRIFDALAASEANERRHLVIGIDGCPWPDIMREQVRSFMEHERQMFTRNINIDEIGIKPLDQYFLESQVDRKIAVAFREGDGVSLTEYLRGNGVFLGKLFWIAGVTEPHLAAWLPFLKQYHPKNSNDGIFVLEYSGGPEGLTEISFPKTVVLVKMAQNASLYDRLSFAMTLAADRGEPETWKHCLARLVVYFYENNIEMLSDVLLNSNGIDGLLNTLKYNDESRFVKAQWKAQLEILFPLIENLREKLVEKYYNAINEALVRNDELFFGRRITDPLDAELGLIFYLANKRDHKGDKYLYLPYADYSMLADIHEYRNLLAHRKCLEIDAVNRIIEFQGTHDDIRANYSKKDESRTHEYR